MNSQTGALIASAIIGAGAGFLTATVTLVANNYFQRRAKKDEDKLRVTRELQGLRIRLKQDMITRFEAVVHQTYHEKRIAYFTAHTEVRPAIPGLDLSQGERWSLKAEKWTENITNDLASLSEALCEASVLFRGDSHIQDMINEFLNFPVPFVTSEPAANATLEDITEWDEKAVKQLQQLVDKSYGDPLAKIISDIQKQL